MEGNMLHFAYISSNFYAPAHAGHDRAVHARYDPVTPLSDTVTVRDTDLATSWGAVSLVLGCSTIGRFHCMRKNCMRQHNIIHVGPHSHAHIA